MSYIFSRFDHKHALVDVHFPSNWCLPTIQNNIKAAPHSKNSIELLSLLTSIEKFKEIFENNMTTSEAQFQTLTLLPELKSVIESRLRKISEKETVKKRNSVYKVTDSKELLVDLDSTKACLTYFTNELSPIEKKIQIKFKSGREIQNYSKLLDDLYSKSISAMDTTQENWEEPLLESLNVNEKQADTSLSRSFILNAKKMDEIILKFDSVVALENIISQSSQAELAVTIERIKREKAASQNALVTLTDELDPLKHSKKKLRHCIVLLDQLEKIQSQKLKDLVATKQVVQI